MDDNTPIENKSTKERWHKALPPIGSLVQVLARQAAREWLQSHEAANDNTENSPNVTKDPS